MSYEEVRRAARWFMAALLALASSALLAQGTSTRGFMWEARKGDARIVLLGTVHVGQTGLTELTEAQLQRVREAAAIAVEADVSDAQRTFASFQRHAMLAADAPGLDRSLPPPLRDRLEKLLPRYGLSPEAVWRMKPWVVANNLVVMEAMRLGFSPALSTEAQLFELARAADVPILEIESVDRQLALFDSAPTELQLAYLDEAVSSIETGAGEQEIRDLLSAWRSSDEAAMRKRLTTMSASRNAGERWIAEHVIERRHPAMLAAIDRFAASGKVHVVAVGALHFFGPKGLLDGLRARGYRITALPG